MKTEMRKEKTMGAELRSWAGVLAVVAGCAGGIWWWGQAAESRVEEFDRRASEKEEIRAEAERDAARAEGERRAAEMADDFKRRSEAYRLHLESQERLRERLRKVEERIGHPPYPAVRPALPGER